MDTALSRFVELCSNRKYEECRVLLRQSQVFATDPGLQDGLMTFLFAEDLFYSCQFFEKPKVANAIIAYSDALEKLTESEELNNMPRFLMVFKTWIKYRLETSTILRTMTQRFATGQSPPAASDRPTTYNQDTISTSNIIARISEKVRMLPMFQFVLHMHSSEVRVLHELLLLRDACFNLDPKGCAVGLVHLQAMFAGPKKPMAPSKLLQWYLAYFGILKCRCCVFFSRILSGIRDPLAVSVVQIIEGFVREREASFFCILHDNRSLEATPFQYVCPRPADDPADTAKDGRSGSGDSEKGFSESSDADTSADGPCKDRMLDVDKAQDKISEAQTAAALETLATLRYGSKFPKQGLRGKFPCVYCTTSDQSQFEIHFPGAVSLLMELDDQPKPGSMITVLDKRREVMCFCCRIDDRFYGASVFPVSIIRRKNLSGLKQLAELLADRLGFRNLVDSLFLAFTSPSSS
eukprot:ANDGO_04039.mRNA.1 hypothetical protein